MPFTDIDDNEMKEMLDIIKRGLSRFYSEGFTHWTKQDLLNSFKKDVDINDPRIQATLQSWQSKGYIRLVGDNDQYLTVYKPFPSSEKNS